MQKIFGSRLALVLICILAGSMVAQAGVVQGLVTDSTGTPVDSARVMLKKCGGCGGGGGISYTTYTGSDGTYLFSTVSAGFYRAMAMKTGIGRDKDTLTVVASGSYTVNFILLPGGCGMGGTPADSCGMGGGGGGGGGGGCHPDSCSMGGCPGGGGGGGGGCQGDTCTAGGCGGCGGEGFNPNGKTKITGSYPNPFNPSTTIGFMLPQSGAVNLSVYNLNGQRVAQLVNGAIEAGNHQVVWNAANLASGIYLVRLEAANTVSIKRVVFMK
jgi:hypothetical protein